MATAAQRMKAEGTARAAKATKAPKVAAAFTLIRNTADLNAAIKSIATRSAKLDADIHRAAVSVIYHSAQHNDPDVATRLVAALGKSARRNGMVAWLCAYGAFATNDSGELAYVKERREQVMSDTNIEAATAEPFWEFSPDPKYQQFDLAKAIASILKKAEAAMTKKEQDTSLVQPDKLAALRALVNEEGIKVVPLETPTE